MTIATDTTSTARVQHTAWCTDHVDGEKYPEDGFCKGGEVTVAGRWETYLTGDYGDPAEECRISVVGGDDGSPAEVEQLIARRAYLLGQAEARATDTGHAKSRLNIEGFYRTGADGRTTSFDTLRDTGGQPSVPRFLVRSRSAATPLWGRSRLLDSRTFVADRPLVEDETSQRLGRRTGSGCRRY